MSSDKHVGRLLGALLLLHLIGGLILPYILLDNATAPSFLPNAAAHSTTIRIVVTLFIAAAALVLAMAIAAQSVFRVAAERLSMALLGVAIANLSLQLVESGMVLTMLSLSRNFVTATASEAATLQAAAVIAGTARRWAHYTQLLTIVSWLFLLYLTLWRTAFVPRLIAAAGLLTTVMQISGVSLRAILGYAPIMQMAMPLAPVHATLALWLMVKGLNTGAAAIDRPRAA